MAQKHRRKLSNYLLDRRLQLRYVVFVTAISAIISVVLGYMIYRQETKASDAINQVLIASGYDAEVNAFVMGDLQQDDSNLISIMAVFGVGLVFVLSLYLIVMTHKVAGPLFKVTTYFDKMAEGNLGEVYALRKGDMLQDFYSHFREAHKAVRDRHARDNRAVAAFLDACDRADVGTSDDELGAQIKALRAFKRKRDEALA